MQEQDRPQEEKKADNAPDKTDSANQNSTTDRKQLSALLEQYYLLKIIDIQQVTPTHARAHLHTHSHAFAHTLARTLAHICPHAPPFLACYGA